MSDFHMSGLHRPRLHHEPRVMVAIAMAAIAAVFVFSVAVSVSSITHGVMTAASGLPPPAINTPETTGSGSRG